MADSTGVQLGFLANRVIDELRRVHPTGWSAMQSEFNLIVNPATVTTGDMTAGAATIGNIASGTGGFSAGNWQVSGAGIPAAARLKSVDSPSAVTLTMHNTNGSDLTATTLTFSQDTYAMPTDFDQFQNRSMWDRTNRWELLGPDSPQMDQWHRSGIVVTGPRRHFRFLNPPIKNQFRIWPSPAEIANPLQLVFEYCSISAVNVNGAGTTFAQYFVNDLDTSLLDENALMTGMKWMFWEIKGFGSYITMQNRWVDYVNRLIGRDGASETLTIVKRVHPIFISPANVQDGFYPGPVGPNQA
jgi:hypothetical protein